MSRGIIEVIEPAKATAAPPTPASHRRRSMAFVSPAASGGSGGSGTTAKSTAPQGGVGRGRGVGRSRAVGQRVLQRLERGDCFGLVSLFEPAPSEHAVLAKVRGLGQFRVFMCRWGYALSALPLAFVRAMLLCWCAPDVLRGIYASCPALWGDLPRAVQCSRSGIDAGSRPQSIAVDQQTHVLGASFLSPRCFPC